MFEIDLEWPVASRYELRPVPELHEELALYPEEGATVSLRRPLEQNPSLYAEFAGLDGSAQACLIFAQKYGPLTNTPTLDTLRFWRGHIEYMKSIIQFCELGRSNPKEAFRRFGREERSLYSTFDFSVSMQTPNAPPAINIRCVDLMGAMEFQAVQSILDGRKSLQCIECSTWFEIGSGARRSQSKFCSPRCKDSYHNRLKAAKKSAGEPRVRTDRTRRT
jgi:hypothetical protein